MVSETTVSGLKELDAALKQFTAKIEGNIVRGGVRAGTAEFRKRAASYIKDDTGALRRSLRIRTKLKRGKVSATLLAGDKDAFYAHMVEFGTAPHLIQATAPGGTKNIAARINRQTKKAGALAFGGVLAEQVNHPGSKPKPFMRPALDGGQAEAVQKMAEYIKKRITKEALK